MKKQNKLTSEQTFDIVIKLACASIGKDKFYTEEGLITTEGLQSIKDLLKEI